MKHLSLKTDKHYMKQAIALAGKAKGATFPNPLVGCVVVKNNKVISKAFHQEFGGPHAEALALKKVGKRAEGATLYVSLEPCSYFGKTPACTEIIIRSKIKRVVVALEDPNPLNSGRGIKILKDHNIEVSTNVLRYEAVSLNREFIKRMKSEKPFISLKLAQSLDGKIATKSGDSKWISSKASRERVQLFRKKHDAIMIGVNTLIKDNPYLTIRKSKREPVAIILDSNLKSPITSKLFNSIKSRKIIVATTEKASYQRECALKSKGIKVLRAGKGQNVNLKLLLKQLLKEGVGSILVEGGGQIASSLLKESLVDKIYLFIAPIIIGGKESIGSFNGKGVDRVKAAYRLKNIKLERIDSDILIEGECL